MIGSSILAGCLFAVSALGAPSKAVEQQDHNKIIGRWALLDFSRQCARYQCHYNFTIDEHDGEPVICAFGVTGRAKGILGGGIDFDNAECARQSCRFKINGEFNREGFEVITVTDVTKNANAFFGYTDTELLQDKVGPKESDAYVVGTFGSDDSVKTSNLVALIPVPQEDKGLLQWKITNVTWDYKVNERTTYVDFTLFIQDGTREDCHVRARNTELRQNWYAQECPGTHFTVSWGYTTDYTNGAVMGICDHDEHRMAWFGWNDIYGHPNLADKQSPFRGVDCE